MGISTDATADAASLASSHQIVFPLLSDPEMAVTGAYGLAMEGKDIAVPAVIIVAPGGEVIFAHVGETMTDRPRPLELLQVVRNWVSQHR